MPFKFKDLLPEKDYAGWLGLGLALLLVSQLLAARTETLAVILRWLLLAAAAVNYGVVLYLYDRNRRAKQKEKPAGSEERDPRK